MALVEDEVTERVEWLLQQLCHKYLTAEAALELYQKIPAWELPEKDESTEE